MARTRALVAFSLLLTLVALLLPAEAVCAALMDSKVACPMSALQAPAPASCHGSSVQALGGCCCSMKEERDTVPVPLLPEAMATSSTIAAAPAVVLVADLPSPAQQPQPRGVQPRPLPPPVDLFLQHSSFLI